jgi:deoxyadenosine/deoxycytidine kinase
MFTITIVSIEGNIGSGKSTLLQKLRGHYIDVPEVIFLKEPVDEWEKIRDENGVTILEKFYDNQKKYSFPFQMMAYVSRLKLLKDTLKNIDTMYSSTTIKKNIIIITERSLYTDKLVFAKMLYDAGKIEYVNYQIYLSWFDTFIEDYPVNKIIYVKASPESCHMRILKRSRDGESNIPLEYLDDCDKYHNDMIGVDAQGRQTTQTTQKKIYSELLTLNGNEDIYKNHEIIEEWIDKIDKFIH